MLGPLLPVVLKVVYDVPVPFVSCSRVFGCYDYDSSLLLWVFLEKQPHTMWLWVKQGDLKNLVGKRM